MDARHDCFGAGQQVTQVVHLVDGIMQRPEIAAPLFEVFIVMRQLHELLWYLSEALTLRQAGPLHRELNLALDKTERLTQGNPDALRELDVAAHRREVMTYCCARANRAAMPSTGRSTTGEPTSSAPTSEAPT